MIAIIDALAGLLDLADELAWAAALAFVRIGAMAALMPGVGEPAVPQRVKLVLIISYALVLSPLLADRLGESGPEPSFIALAGEAVAGLVLGVGLRLFLVALQTAAAIIAQATTLSQLFAGSAPEPQPAMGNLLLIAAVALAITAGLHVKAAELILLSYQILPAGAYLSAADAADWSLNLIGRTFSLAFTLAAPFMIASLVYNLALGAINRAMPTLMVSMVGAPAQILGALVLLAVASPFLLAAWLAAFSEHLAQPFATSP